MKEREIHWQEHTNDVKKEELEYQRKSGYIPYTILKGSETMKRKENASEPLCIHINILVQLLYEAFKEIDFETSLIVPTIVVLNSSTVTNLHEPGIYTVNFQENQLERIGYVAHIKAQTSLAIGYTIRLKGLASVHHEEIGEAIENSLIYMTHKLSGLLTIHGELTSYLENNHMKEQNLYGHHLSSIILYQWITKKS